MTELSAIRNIAFVGHPSSGKTAIVDALAHLIGATDRKGSVADKTSICDTEPEEHDRQHTLQLHAIFGQWGDHQWTLLDTPGYPEFQAEVQSAMFGADLVVGVISCASGPTYNLRTKMRAAKELGRGRAIIITHLDAENADFETILDQVRQGVGRECVPVLLPNADGPEFSSVGRTMLHPESDWCQKLKDRVMDGCEDEELLMEYLDSQQLTEEQLDQHMPTAIARGNLVPVLVCNPAGDLALENILEYLKRFAPCPADIPPVNDEGEVLGMESGGELAGTVFNVVADPHVGKVCLARIHRGTLTTSDHISTDGSKGEKLGGLFRMVGKKRETIESAGPGTIVAFSKVEKVGIWEHFTLAGGTPAPVVTPRVPSPMVALAVVPKTRADEQKIGEALRKLTAEDPTFVIEHAQDTKEVVAHGMSDLHLQLMFQRMLRRYGVAVETHLPKIAFRQTITKASQGHHRHKKQTGGRGQFGECYMRLKPATQGEGIVFQDKVVGGSIPRNLIPAVEKGLREICAGGILVEGEVVDVEVELYDGKFHAVDSDEGSFKKAGARAFRDGFEKGGPVLLEPVMKLEVRVPTSDAGTIFSDVTSQRRGHVLDQASEEDGAITVIIAEVPLSMIQTYHRDLKSQTAGEGAFTMSFERFAPMPAAEQQKVMANIGKKHEEED
jgi:elongation factor G